MAGGFWVVGGRSGSAGAGSVCLSWAPGAAVVRLGLGGGLGALSEVYRSTELRAARRRLAGSTGRLSPALGDLSGARGPTFDRSSQQAV